MEQTSATTSNTPQAPDALGGKQNKYWIEIQLVDDSGNPVANMPYNAENQATRTGHEDLHSGNSDADGVIRIDNMHLLNLTLKIAAQPLADEMETRPLCIKRINEMQMKMQPTTVESGLICYRSVIGRLCDSAPNIPEWKEKTLPAFHFPDPGFSGLEISSMYFNARVIVKICPFRAWVLLLHHTKNYSIVNAMNLGLMANFSYESRETIYSFFKAQCLDVSQVPILASQPICIDIPFSERYIDPVFMDTSEGDSAAGGTQLFYVHNKTQLLIGWRGTEPTKLADIVADGTFRPVLCPDILPGGRGHMGFLDAFRLASSRFTKQFEQMTKLGSEKNLFICGHSLGGALTLIHAATLQHSDPVIYTYGMPRIFCASSVGALNNLTHYRHVNDTDTVTSVPPAAELDNAMYDIWGPHGTIYGTGVSVGQIIIQQSDIGKIITQKLGGDPFWHHGNLVVFFKAEQSQIKPSAFAWAGELGAFITIQTMMPKKAKFFLIPSLNESAFCTAGEHQKMYFTCLDPKSVDHYFPENTNPSLDSITNPANHSMQNKYVPYLHNQLLELVDPELPLERKEKRKAFAEQVESSAKSINKVSQDEITRNRLFLALQDMLPVTLDISESEVTWQNALVRFKEVAKEDHENID